MFTVKLKELMNFKEVSSCLEGKVIPMRTGYSLTKIKAAALSELEFYQEEIRKLVIEDAQVDENGELIFTEDGSGLLLKEDKIEDFAKRMDELDSIEIEIPCDKIKLSDIETLDINFDYIEILMPFITEE